MPRVASRCADLDARLACPPAGEDPSEPDGPRLVALEAARDEHAGARDAANQRCGGLQGQLEASEARRAEHAERARELVAAREDSAHWASIAELIGVNEGQRFVTFVQALHLGRVITEANRRLEAFMPRYALEQLAVDGQPRLDFVVIDRWNLDAVRPIRGLSGGESFVVSLALALGLADTRASRLRIETLLIDEGFGTLDARTLQEVIAALQQLQMVTGAQVGLVSHVESLRESIPAQIEVIPVGEGRSRVEVRG